MTNKVRKQFLLDPELLHRAREALDARTDTEAIERALKKIVDDAEADAEIDRAHRALLKSSGGRFRDVFGALDGVIDP
jgi:hypothetical protein